MIFKLRNIINLSSNSISPSISFEGDIGLWTTSLILSIISIVFAITASFYSSKASKDVKKLIKTQWITDQANKIFFTNLKEIDTLTTNVIARLRSETSITFFDYASISANCRIHPISQESFLLLQETKFKDLTHIFRSTKILLDNEFFKIVSIEKLKQIEIMDENTKNKLIKYHLSVKENIKKILKEYTIISTS